MQQKYIKPCKRCNKLFAGIKAALYCDDCRLAMRYVYNKKYHEQKKFAPIAHLVNNTFALIAVANIF